MRTRASFFLSLIPVFLSAALYYPIVGRYFSGDDFVHLYQIVDCGFLRFLITPNGGHLLISSNLVFYLCYQAFALNAAGYHWLALLTHLLNVWLLFQVIRGFTHRPFLAAFGATAWGSSPVNLGSVGWFSVYGHELAATGIFLVLWEIARLSREKKPIRNATIVRWYLLLLVAGTSFGVGFGVAAVFGAVIYLLLPLAENRNRLAVVFGSLAVVLPAIYLVTFQMYFGRNARFIHSIIALGPNSIYAFLSMSFHLFAYGLSSFLFGPLIAWVLQARVFFGPIRGASPEAAVQISLVVFGVFAAGLALALKRGARETRMQIAAFALIAVSAYGIIAMGRSGYYQGLKFSLALAISAERYHYLGPMALAVMFCLMVSGASTMDAVKVRWGRSLFLIWAAGTFFFYLQTNRAGVDPDGTFERWEHAKVVALIRREVEGSPKGANVYIENKAFGTHLLPLVFPGYAAIFVISYPENTVAGRRVYFIEKEERIRTLAASLGGTRLPDLLVAPDR